MAVRTISTSIKLDGEQEFKKQMSSVNSELKTLKSEMALVTSEFKGQANSVDALTDKNRILRQQYAQQAEKVRALQQAVADSTEVNGEADVYKRQACGIRQEDSQRNGNRRCGGQRLCLYRSGAPN